MQNWIGNLIEDSIFHYIFIVFSYWLCQDDFFKECLSYYVGPSFRKETHEQWEMEFLRIQLKMFEEQVLLWKWFFSQLEKITQGKPFSL